MNQTILKSQDVKVAPACLGRTVVVWGLFGLAMALAARIVGSGLAAQVVVWCIGALVGLAIASREI